MTEQIYGVVSFNLIKIKDDERLHSIRCRDSDFGEVVHLSDRSDRSERSEERRVGKECRL